MTEQRWLEVSRTWLVFIPVRGRRLFVVRKDQSPTWRPLAIEQQEHFSAASAMGAAFWNLARREIQILGRLGASMNFGFSTFGFSLSAEAWVITFQGEPEATPGFESYWVNFADIREQPSVFDKGYLDVLLMGVSIASAPVYTGPVTSELETQLQARLVIGPNYERVCGGRYWVRVTKGQRGKKTVDVWNNLTLDPTASAEGVLPGGFL